MAPPAGYHDEDDLVDWLVEVAARPNVTVREIGRSVEGRALSAVDIRPGPGSPDRPVAVVIANIHGCEVVSSELAVALVDALTAPPSTAETAALLRTADVTVVPVVNPDGRARSLASLNLRRPWRSAPRRNAHGVDLNRNWPWVPGVRDHWSPLSGTSRFRSPWYRGPHPLSEPETQAVAALLEQQPPSVLLNLHSTGQIVTYPWGGRKEPTQDAARFADVATAFVDAQPTRKYRYSQSNAWYPIVGSCNDWAYATLGTLALTVETARPGEGLHGRLSRIGTFFWYANPDRPAPHVANDLPACIAALRAGTTA